MKWEYGLALYTRTHCVARGLRPLTIASYTAALQQFREYVRVVLHDVAPEAVTARDVLEYVEHLRTVRGNGAAAVNRQVVIVKNFYRALVAMDCLTAQQNPLVLFPALKAAPRKLPVTLATDEMQRLLNTPGSDTVLGLRDRALLVLLYATGMRASECTALCEGDVDLKELTVRVHGKGGHERTLPLNGQAAAALAVYRQARGPALPRAPFFWSRSGRRLSRGAIYERVRGWGQRARLPNPISPHRLRHTFATHLVKSGVGLVTIRDLLGHRQITSTQIYLHVTAHDLRAAAERHPIGRLLESIAPLLPELRLPIQHAARCRGSG